MKNLPIFLCVTLLCSIIHVQSTTIVLGLSDGRILFWDWHKQVGKGNLTGHTDAVTGLTFTSEGCLASSSYDKTIRIWNVTSRSAQLVLANHTGFIMAIVRLSNGMLASASLDQSIRFWNTSTGQNVNSIFSWNQNVALVQIDACLLGSSTAFGSINVWNICGAYTLVKTLSGHTNWVYNLDLMSNGTLVSGSMDNTIKTWNCSNGSMSASYLFTNLKIYMLKVFNQKLVVFGGNSKELRVALMDNSQVTVLNLTGANSYTSILTKNENVLIVGMDNSTIQLFNLDTYTSLSIQVVSPIYANVYSIVELVFVKGNLNQTTQPSIPYEYFSDQTLNLPEKAFMFSSNNILDCLNKCRKTPECEAVAYVKTTKVCSIFYLFLQDQIIPLKDSILYLKK